MASLDVDTEIDEAAGQQPLCQPSVAAGKVEDAIARLEPRPELHEELRPVIEVRLRIRVLALGPALRFGVVLAQTGTWFRDLATPDSDRGTSGGHKRG